MQRLPALIGFEKPSKYNIWVAIGGGAKLLFNSRTRALITLSPAESAIAADLLAGAQTTGTASCEVYTALQRGGYLVPTFVDEHSLVESEYVRQRHDTRALSYTVMSTTSCNFGCDYCFQGEHKPKTVISDDTVSAIEAAFRNARQDVRHLHVTWYGGEPLLAVRQIHEASRRFMAVAQTRKLGYDADIVTNGHALTEANFLTLLQCNVKLAQITLDGPRDLHDTRRVLLKGNGGTYDRILANIKNVAGRGIRINIRVNVDVRNWVDVARLLDDLALQGLGLRKQVSVYFARVEAITDACSNIAEHAVPKEAYAHCETKLRKLAISYGLSAPTMPSPFAGICGALRSDSFVVRPDGELHKCWDTIHNPRHSVGNIGAHDRSVEQESRNAQWVGFSPFLLSTCRDCNVLPLCGGACAHKHVNSDQGDNGSELPCPSFRYNLDDRLREIAGVAQGGD